MTKEIKLNQGYVALVDDADYEYINNMCKWSVIKSGIKIYAYGWNPETGKHTTMHALLLQPREGYCTDHKDGDGLNNTRDNLREATYELNCLNRKFDKDPNEFGSIYKGVTLDKRVKKGCKWYARVSPTVAKALGYKSVYLGYFKTQEEAAHAYDWAMYNYAPDWAVYNFPAQKD